MVKTSEYIQNILNVSRILFSHLFSTFVISGPSTSSASVGKMIAGNFVDTDGIAVTDATQCLTDTFTITNQVTVPRICGINSGYHGNF